MNHLLRAAAVAAMGISFMFPISISVANATPCDHETGKDMFGHPGMSLECDTCITRSVQQGLDKSVCGGIAAGINPANPAVTCAAHMLQGQPC